MSQIGSVPNSDSWLYRTSKGGAEHGRGRGAAQLPGATLVTIDPAGCRPTWAAGTAPLTVEDSVRGLRSRWPASLADKGRLLHHDGRRARTGKAPSS